MYFAALLVATHKLTTLREGGMGNTQVSYCHNARGQKVACRDTKNCCSQACSQGSSMSLYELPSRLLEILTIILNSIIILSIRLLLILNIRQYIPYTATPYYPIVYILRARGEVTLLCDLQSIIKLEFCTLQYQSRFQLSPKEKCNPPSEKFRLRSISLSVLLCLSISDIYYLTSFCHCNIQPQCCVAVT